MAYPMIVLFFASTAFITVVSCLSLQTSTETVIVIHGVLSSGKNMDDLKKNIKLARPDIDVHLIDIFHNVESLASMWKQVKGIRGVVSTIMKSAKNGVSMIGFSQGGLVARGLIQTMDDHNVHTFISLSAPLNGQYGKTSYLSKVPNVLTEYLYKVFYTRIGQDISLANYWRDPHHMDKYRRYSQYLAPLNNESLPQSKSMFQNSWKKNFMKLKKVVLIGGPDDGVITPWQSALFGCYNDRERVVKMRQTAIYRKDSFGLKSLDTRHAIIECVVPGIKHVHWHGNLKAFKLCIEPHLPS